MTVKFKHVRITDQDGRIHNLGGYTVAYQEIAPNVINYAYAYCSPEDNFNKKIGRAKAAGRLNSSRFARTTHSCSMKQFGLSVLF